MDFLDSLTGLDTTAVKALTTKLFPEAIAIVRGDDVSFDPIYAKDDQNTLLGIRISFVAEVLVAEPLDPEIDPDSLADRRITVSERLWIRNGALATEGIGYLKGLFEKAGIDSTGVMRTEDGEGWLYNFVGAQFSWAVSHSKTGKYTNLNVAWLPMPTE